MIKVKTSSIPFDHEISRVVSNPRCERKTYVAFDQFDIAAAVGIVFVLMRVALDLMHYLGQASRGKDW